MGAFFISIIDTPISQPNQIRHLEQHGSAGLVKVACGSEPVIIDKENIAARAEAVIEQKICAYGFAVAIPLCENFEKEIGRKRINQPRAQRLNIEIGLWQANPIAIVNQLNTQPAIGPIGILCRHPIQVPRIIRPHQKIKIQLQLAITRRIRPQSERCERVFVWRNGDIGPLARRSKRPRHDIAGPLHTHQKAVSRLKREHAIQSEPLERHLALRRLQSPEHRA